MRIFHGCRRAMRYYADESGVCANCGSCFNTRLRLLRHLIDTRRTKCADAIVTSGIPRLTESRVVQFDLADREQRRRAQREGSAHLVVVGPA